MSSLKKQSISSANEILISACTIKTVAGDECFLPFSAVSTKMGYSKPSEVYEQTDKKGQAKPVLVSSMADVVDYHDLDRIYYLLESSLEEICQDNSARINGKRVIVCCMLPSTDTTRGEYIDPEDWEEALRDSSYVLRKATFRFFPVNKMSPTTVLGNISDALQEDKAEFVLFGAADSLIDSVTFTDLASKRKLQTVSSPDGKVLSEGASWLLFENAEKAEESADALGFLSGMATEKIKSNDGCSAFESSISKSLASSGIELDEIKNIYINMGAEYKSQLEWYQVVKKLWPSNINEQQRMAIMLGEIDGSELGAKNKSIEFPIHIALGECGAACFLMQLSVCLEGFKYEQAYESFGFSKSDYSLVCDSSNETRRGAVVLSAPRKKLERKQLGNTAADLELVDDDYEEMEMLEEDEWQET